MRTLKSTLFLVILILSITNVFAQYNLEWNFTNLGASTGSINNNMHCYSNGDVLVSGRNNGDLDPGPGYNNSGTASGGDFFARYSQAGTLVFGRPWFYSAPTGSSSLYADAIDSGDKYYFIFSGADGTYDLDTAQGPGIGELTISNYSQCVARLDENGDFDGGFGLSGNINMYGIKVLTDKSILIAGELEGSADFDPGPGVVNINPSGGFNHMFLLKLDSTFNFIDVKIMQSLNGSYPFGFRFHNLDVDATGNIYLGGSFIGNVDLDPGPGTYLQSYTPPFSQPWSASWGTGVVIKLNSSMNFVNGYLFPPELYMRPVTDPYNNIYFYGNSNGNKDVDPGPGVTLISNTTVDEVFYIAKYDSLFNLSWVKSTHDDNFSTTLVKYGRNNQLNFLGWSSDTIRSNGFGIPHDNSPYSVSAMGQYLHLVSLDTSGIATQCINLGRYDELGSSAGIYSDANHFYTSGRLSDTTDIQIGPGITLQGPNTYSSYNFFISYYSTDPNISQIRGNAYIDQNGNNIKDSNEGGAQGLIVAIDPGNYFISTGSSGDFGAYVTPSSYNITIPTVPLNYFPPQPSVHAANFTTGYQLDTANNFALQLDLTRQDLIVTLTNVAGTRPGFPLNYNLTVKNIGGNSQSGSVSLYLDNKLTFLSSSTAPVIITGDTLTWNFVNLMPLQSLNYNILTLVDSLASIGDTVLSTTQALPLIGDIDTTNNFNESLSIVTGSYDPNDKASVPDNAVPIVFMQNGQFIEYTIRFQNLGNDTAFNVIILDTLSNHLDIGSLDIVACSHNYNFNLYPSRLLEIKMPNILLPDSGVNEVKSNGFIKYRIRIKNNLNLGDIVYNTAHIYFDYNQPVATNTTALEVVQFTNQNEISDATNEIIVYPNPSSGITTIVFNNQGNISGKIEVTDMSGRVVMNIPSFTDNKVQLDLNLLGSGIYLVKSELTTGKKYFAKIILTNEED
ncbi:MAG: T9SS type A sorting domain-containing protein [Bacteroidia bacterium]|nr:T9SS type A sorting domain-containing protein [Bacteroidia bacterium]